MYDERRRRREPEVEVFNIENWTPKTQIGQAVKSKKILTIEQIFESGKPIREVEIVDALLPTLENKVVEVASVQRMTKNNRRQKFRVTAIVGDGNGHVGIGTAKDVEAKPAIDAAIMNAKLNIMPVILGCGSWECACGTKHSLPLIVRGKCGTSEVILKPAPRGVGVVANEVVKALLGLAGVKDIWTFSRGRTRDIYNIALATQRALQKAATIRNPQAIKD